MIFIMVHGGFCGKELSCGNTEMVFLMGVPVVVTIIVCRNYNLA